MLNLKWKSILNQLRWYIEESILILKSNHSSHSIRSLQVLKSHQNQSIILYIFFLQYMKDIQSKESQYAYILMDHQNQ